MKCVSEKIVKIHGVIFLESVLILPVYSVYDLSLKVFSFSVQILLGTAVGFLLFAYYRAQVIYRIFLSIYILIFLIWT